MAEAKPLIEVKQDETFLTDERDVKAALVHVRQFASTEPIGSWEEAREVADAIKDLRLTVKAAEEHRKGIKAPYEATEEHIDGHYKELLAQPNAAIQRLKQKAGAFKRAEDESERERQRKEQERLDREAEEAAAAAQKAAEKVAEDPTDQEARQEAANAHSAAATAAVATAAPVNPPKQVRGSFGAIGLRTTYQHEVVDVSVLPAEHMMANDKSIKAAIQGELALAKAQKRPVNLDLIPGVKIVAVGGEVSR